MELILRHKGTDNICKYDDSDHDIISQYKFHYRGGYAVSGKIKMHRLILGLTDPKIIVDHKDRDRLNNSRSNLRVCTSSQNSANRSKTKGVSKFKGVTRHHGKWEARLVHEGRIFHFGHFRAEKTAARVYDKSALEKFGEFALTNLPEESTLPEQLQLF
jgi:hypothetical protein